MTDQVMTTLQVSALVEPRNEHLLDPSSGQGVDNRVASAISIDVRRRLHELSEGLSTRTEKIKHRIEQPPTPEESDEEDSTVGGETRKISLRDFVANIDEQAEKAAGMQEETSWLTNPRLAFAKRVWHPGTGLYIFWIALMSVTLVYNALAIPMRATYPYQDAGNLPFWMFLDYLSDFIYVLDMWVVRYRTSITRGGIEITDIPTIQSHYIHSWVFKKDLIAILPTDIFYAVAELKMSPLIRLNRLFKHQRYSEFFEHLDSSVKNPYTLRVVYMLSYMVYLIHCNSCLFYAFSVYHGLGSTSWVYDGQGNAYIRCFYFTTKLATSIGNNPWPTNVYEVFYVLLCWMSGVFVFAAILGQIQDIVRSANKLGDEFRQTMDTALLMLKDLGISPSTQDKAREWFVRTWEEQKTLDEARLIAALPMKMQTDLAISVHYKTLSKVQLFQNCENALLRDLVLKLRPSLFLPGDYVCRKGEVGKEMYIVNTGAVEVVGGPEGKTVFVTLSAGSVFGEIALLAVGTGNRRTADVKAKGFALLFELSKDDLEAVIVNYPDAQKILQRKARKLVKKHKERDTEDKESTIQSDVALKVKGNPRLLNVALKMMRRDSATAEDIRRRVKHVETDAV